jgi:serine/threonine protein kinase
LPIVNVSFSPKAETAGSTTLGLAILASMSIDRTQDQGGHERRRARQLSLQRVLPPTEVPGYEPERFLGVGAYGEVWVAVEQNTGRRVAIKFYAHRGGLDWSLLSREVEKLAFLFADRYVVQLIGVGWDSDPPYYIMEYLEEGSLAERLGEGTLPVNGAVQLFREVAVGLVHAHGKGVLHCDLKPANILLDQDNKPRLADFGQSRLSHEQAPALGTLFYMAPEQADLEAVPDARWDVYALGALLYCMITGSPPYRDEGIVQELEQAGSLEERLTHYRRAIRRAPKPNGHRRVTGVDRSLAEIVDRCLAVDPKKRYPNVQAVLAALDAREAQLARRPMMILGAVGPVLLLSVVSLFAWWGFSTALDQSEAALTRRALESSGFAAQFAARSAANQLERRYEAVEQVANSDRLRQAIRNMIDGPEMQQLIEQLCDPKKSDEELKPLRQRFRAHPDRIQLQEQFDALIPVRMRPPTPGSPEEGPEAAVASWFFCEANGLSAVRLPEPEPEKNTIGLNYAWRSYFHGGPADHDRNWRPRNGEHVEQTKPSDVFTSQANNQWIVAISTPVYGLEPEPELLGVVALTVKVGQLVEQVGKVGEPDESDDQFAVLVDWRDGDHKGVVLDHPLFKRLLSRLPELPDRFEALRVQPDALPATLEETKRAASAGVEPPTVQRSKRYHDPLADDPDGGQYNKHWLAQMEPIMVRDETSGWLVIVQESYDGAIGATLRELRNALLVYGLIALATVALVIVGLWAFALRMLRHTSPGRMLTSLVEITERSANSVTPDGPTETHPEGGRRS